MRAPPPLSPAADQRAALQRKRLDQLFQPVAQRLAQLSQINAGRCAGHVRTHSGTPPARSCASPRAGKKRSARPSPPARTENVLG